MKKLRTPNTAWNRLVFMFFLLTLLAQIANGQASAKIKFSNTYVNLSKKNTGGTVEPGDTLEIRTCIYLSSTYNGNGRIYYVRYLDSIPLNTDTLAADSLRLITNEGLTFRRYTLDASDGDAGAYVKTPGAGNYQVRINMGGAPFAANPSAPLNNSITDLTGSSNIRAGSGQNKPIVFGNYLVVTSFRVRVTGNVGDTIVLGAGQIRFKQSNSTSAADTVLNAIPYKIRITQNAALCADNTGTSILAEYGGTFGSGASLNRATGPTYPIPVYTYVPDMGLSNSVNDGFYAIVNNSSPRASTNPDARIQPNCNVPSGAHASDDSCNNRMFNGFWDITGDHTGSTNALGNPPPADGTTGGYMLMVNADLATSEAYRQTISGLCPNTYYEFSAWVRNVCRTCGLDSNSTQQFKPGVLPNLTFTVDDIDRYSTGFLDTLGWQKKGFIFKTEPGQTSFTISIRNNAPGGGGNDWLLDDITLATCTPNLNLVPNANAQVCLNNAVDMNCTVRSYFDNYINWAWEESTDGGTNWISTGVSGTGSPAPIGGSYEYTAVFPTFIADSSDHNRRFRVKVATSPDNLNNSTCSFAASNTIVVLVNNCLEVLKAGFLSIDGKLQNGYGTIEWITDNETANTRFEIERSEDRIRFRTVAKVAGKAPQGFGSTYSLTDNTLPVQSSWYRIRMIEGNSEKYSQIVYLSRAAQFGIRALVNPFVSHLNFEVSLPEAGNLEIILLDTYGRPVKKANYQAEAGIRSIQLNNLGNLPQGTYTLRVRTGDQVIHKRVLKIMR